MRCRSLWCWSLNDIPIRPVHQVLPLQDTISLIREQSIIWSIEWLGLILVYYYEKQVLYQPSYFFNDFYAKASFFFWIYLSRLCPVNPEMISYSGAFFLPCLSVGQQPTTTQLTLILHYSYRKESLSVWREFFFLKLTWRGNSRSLNMDPIWTLLTITLILLPISCNSLFRVRVLNCPQFHQPTLIPQIQWIV